MGYDSRRTLRATAWIVMGLGLGTVAGCLRFGSFQCQQDNECSIDRRAGQCLTDQSLCVYFDDSCPSERSDALGECVSLPATTSGDDGSGGNSGINPSSESGSRPPSADSVAPVDPTESDSSTTTDSVEPGDSSSSGDLPVGCFSQPLTLLTPDGVVQASSIYDDAFRAFLSADGRLETSWFSGGPEEGVSPSTYEWSVLEPRCIARISIIGNGLHQISGFRENFGFESVVIRVFDEDDNPVFQQMMSLAGTPDPTVTVEPNVRGVKVVLELSQHESNDCGGFGELEIEGW